MSLFRSAPHHHHTIWPGGCIYKLPVDGLDCCITTPELNSTIVSGLRSHSECNGRFILNVSSVQVSDGLPSGVTSQPLFFWADSVTSTTENNTAAPPVLGTMRFLLVGLDLLLLSLEMENVSCNTFHDLCSQIRLWHAFPRCTICHQVSLFCCSSTR